LALNIQLWPVVILADRYQGTYSGGAWLAVANADIPIGRNPRAAWLLDNGPGGEDAEARQFWDEAHDWIAVADSPDAALSALHLKAGV
jgi:hypothetical protein